MKVGQHLVQWDSCKTLEFQDLERGQWHKRQDHNSDFEEQTLTFSVICLWDGPGDCSIQKSCPAFKDHLKGLQRSIPSREQEGGRLFSVVLTDRVRDTKWNTRFHLVFESNPLFFFYYKSAQKQVSCAESWWNLTPWRYSKPSWTQSLATCSSSPANFIDSVILWNISCFLKCKKRQSRRKLDMWGRKARSQTPYVGDWDCAGKTELVICSLTRFILVLPDSLNTLFTVSVPPLMNNFALFVSQRDT